MKNFEVHKPVVMSNAYKLIPDVAALGKVGAGHDGIVYRYGDYVFKVLKYDIDVRKAKDLMTFEKATYFVNNLHLNRIAQPIDILLDSDGVYTGYVMRFFDDGKFNFRDHNLCERNLREIQRLYQYLYKSKIFVLKATSNSNKVLKLAF